jgi:hypothetical protein
MQGFQRVFYGKFLSICFCARAIGTTESIDGYLRRRI